MIKGQALVPVKSQFLHVWLTAFPNVALFYLLGCVVILFYLLLFETSTSVLSPRM